MHLTPAPKWRQSRNEQINLDMPREEPENADQGPHRCKDNRTKMGRSMLRPYKGERKSQRKELLLPLPVGKLLAEGNFFEFADGGAGDGVDEDEGVGELPLGEGLREEGA